MSTKTLGEAIAAQRKALHLEQKDVAERLRSYGVDRAVTTVAGWENGNKVPVEFIKPLANALEMSPLELYELAGIAADLPNWGLLRLTDGLPEKELKRIESILRTLLEKD